MKDASIREMTEEEIRTLNDKRRGAARESVNRWVSCPECGSENTDVGCMGSVVKVRCHDCEEHDNTHYEYTPPGDGR